MIKIVVIVLSLLSWANAFGHAESKEVLAPGWGILSYDAPAPGTYELPPIMNAVDGDVLQIDGSPTRLGELMEDKIVLLSFIYTRCEDVNGCPLVNAVFSRLKDRIDDDESLRNNVRLVSMSFDPDYDTPSVIGNLANGLRGERGEVGWEFLTTRDSQSLQPILEGFGQFTFPEYDTHGNYTGRIAHLLRVYLIDRNQTVRNIYSAGFLHPDILENDCKTLLMENSVN